MEGSNIAKFVNQLCKPWTICVQRQIAQAASFLIANEEVTQLYCDYVKEEMETLDKYSNKCGAEGHGRYYYIVETAPTPIETDMCRTSFDTQTQDQYKRFVIAELNKAKIIDCKTCKYRLICLLRSQECKRCI